MGGTGEIPAELWEVSVEPGDELTVFGASYRSRDTHKDLHFVDELCSLEVPAFWKKSIPQISSNVKHSKLREKHINTFFCRPPFFFFLRRYNFREVLAFSTNSFHLSRFLMQFFQFIFVFVISLFTSSSHLFLGLPSDLVHTGVHSYTF